MVSRRDFLAGTTAATAVLFSHRRLLAAAPERFPNPLKIPALLEGAPGAGGRIFELNAAAGKSEFLPGISTPTLGINGAYLGPTIRCRAGDRVTLRVRNSLTEPT